jgi:hypothetical protein
MLWGVLKNNRGKEKDLVATGILGGTGILPVILGATRQSPLQSVSPLRIGSDQYPLPY